MRRPRLSWKTSALLLSSAWSLASAACSPAEGDDSVNGTESGNPDTSDGSTSGGENVTSSTGETTGVESTTMGTTGTTGSTGDDTGTTGDDTGTTGTTGALAGTPTPLFSTEVFPTTLASTKTVITETLSPDLIKVRVQANFVTADYVDFSPQVCLPSKVQCVESYDLDALVAEFKAKGWSMIPMLSHNTQLADIKGGDIDDYVAFVTGGGRLSSPRVGVSRWVTHSSITSTTASRSPTCRPHIARSRSSTRPTAGATRRTSSSSSKTASRRCACRPAAYSRTPHT